MTIQIKAILIIIFAAGSFAGGAYWQYQRDELAALEQAKEATEARDELQTKLDQSDLKLAELQRAKRDVRTETVIEYRTKWRDAPVAVRESCATSGLYEITDAGFGSIGKPGSTDTAK